MGIESINSFSSVVRTSSGGEAGTLAGSTLTFDAGIDFDGGSAATGVGAECRPGGGGAGRLWDRTAQELGARLLLGNVFAAFRRD